MNATTISELTRENGWAPLRAHLGARAFGINAYTKNADEEVVGEHTEEASGHEELYLVVAGRATFTVEGEERDAPVGTAVLVPSGTTRSAKALEDGTTILVVGGTPGEAYRPAPEEVMEAFAAYRAGDYETALAKQRIGAEKRPDNPVDRFNAACFAARAGNADEAIEFLRQAVEINERVRELMAGDEDLDSIRDDPRFAELASS